MAGAGNDHLSVTSWGWLDKDGCQTHLGGGVPAWRLWKVRSEGEECGFLALALDLDALDALTAATQVWADAFH